MEHNPNPFDFVPFSNDGPYLKTRAEFDGMGEMYSGYLELRIKALTPVHIVGYQKESGTERNSYIYRQDGMACIPASTIRGCLRSFIETISNGWVSQVNEKYEKDYAIRHIGFSTFNQYENKHRSGKSIKESAIYQKYDPSGKSGANIDLASYLFGFIKQDETTSNNSSDSPSGKSKLFFEDAYINQNAVDELNEECWAPDISKDAFMGGAKPNASSWWYMQPKEVWKRDINGRFIAEFVGEKFWGRKFYYHQSPNKCMSYYHPENYKWPYIKNSFCKVRLETLRPLSSTETFRIYFDCIPKDLLVFFILCLLPGQNIRHKIGYGKPYGFGSIEFEILRAKMRRKSIHAIPSQLVDMTAQVLTWGGLAWNENQIKRDFKNTFEIIHWESLNKLSKILGIGNFESMLHTYPAFPKGYLFGLPLIYEEEIIKGNLSTKVVEIFNSFGYQLPQKHSIIRMPQKHPKDNPNRWELTTENKVLFRFEKENNRTLSVFSLTGNFATPIPFSKFEKLVGTKGKVSNKTPVSAEQAKKIAQDLFEFKKPIHFQVYQETSLGWDFIKNRQP